MSLKTENGKRIHFFCIDCKQTVTRSNNGEQTAEISNRNRMHFFPTEGKQTEEEKN